MESIFEWNPWADFADLSRQLENLSVPAAPQVATAPVARTRGRGTRKHIDWVPNWDIIELPHQYLVSCELPGLSKEDFRLALENRVLTVQGERKFERREESKCLRCEGNYGKFWRSMAIPTDADPGSISAEFNNGVLQISIQKVEPSKPRTIPIQEARPQTKGIEPGTEGREQELQQQPQEIGVTERKEEVPQEQPLTQEALPQETREGQQQEPFYEQQQKQQETFLPQETREGQKEPLLPQQQRETEPGLPESLREQKKTEELKRQEAYPQEAAPEVSQRAE